MQPLADRIDRLAREKPGAVAFIGDDEVLDWSGYASRSDRLAGHLIARGLQPGDRVAVLLPDGPGVHAAFVGCEKAGLVVLGIGPRAGRAEILHLLGKAGARALLARPVHADMDMSRLVEEARSGGLPLEGLIPIEGELGPDEPALRSAEPGGRGGGDRGDRARGDAGRGDTARRLGVEDLFLLNSTSGTTGLPKCVTHHQARWMHFHELAVEAADMTADDVFLSALPAPFGFGLWTAHFTPTLLGAPTVLMRSFDAAEMIRRIERHRVSVLAAVSTQFIMMLGSEEIEKHDLSSLRALFTGGEAVPYERAAEFEERTGATVLQFYGSNETGALCRTSLRDSREKRLRTAGRLIPEMQVRLYDDAGRDVTASGEGQPACRGALTSRGYYGDEEANRKLFTADGWMLTGDIARIDDEGYLSVVGRTADFIIRGGKNLSGPAIEDAVSGHADVTLAAAVAMPDPVYGERVCVYVELRAGAAPLSVESLAADLSARGISKEWFPERVVVVESLPRSSGGKIAKGELRADIRRRLETEASGA